MSEETVEALVIGAGPAGLMAAEALAAAGHRVRVADAMPSPGRKLLMAGKSGLNLTMDAPGPVFRTAYLAGGAALAPMLTTFGPEEVRAWAAGLGIETFRGSSGRVFPAQMKASPLLRAWLGRLGAAGVELTPRWRWTGWRGDGAATFATPGGPAALRAGATVLALGGGSWARLGSDGAWTATLAAAGIGVAPLRPSNVGFRVAWTPAMARHFGTAVKPLRLMAGGVESRGEMTLSTRGIEGGGVYALAHLLREGAPLRLDLVPDLAAPAVATRLARPRGRASLSNHLRRTLGLPPVKIALLRECAAPALGDAAATAAALKDLPLPLDGPRPMDEAISTAGGVTFASVDRDLMLLARPGVFVAGEMLDWDAPTGGYLLTACLATGRHAGAAAGRWLGARSP